MGGSEHLAVMRRIKECGDRLWLKAAISWAAMALWVALAVGVLMAGLHYFGGIAMPMGLVVTAVMAPLPLAFVAALALRRPTMALAARTLDRLHGRPGLYDAARQVLATDPGRRPGAARIAVARAACHANATHRYPGTLWPARPARFLVPLGLCLGCVFLAVQPMAPIAAPTATGPGTTTPQVRDNTLRDVQEVLRRIAASPEEPVAQYDRNTSDGLIAGAAKMAPEGDTTATAGPRAGFDGDPGKGEDAGDARGSNETELAAPGQVPARKFDVTRLGQRYGSQAGQPLATSGSMPRVPGALAAIEVPTDKVATTLSPLERRLATDYLTRLGAGR